jgi:hypothetical protein
MIYLWKKEENFCSKYILKANGNESEKEWAFLFASGMM